MHFLSLFGTSKESTNSTKVHGVHKDDGGAGQIDKIEQLLQEQHNNSIGIWRKAFHLARKGSIFATGLFGDYLPYIILSWKVFMALDLGFLVIHLNVYKVLRFLDCTNDFYCKDLVWIQLMVLYAGRSSALFMSNRGQCQVCKEIIWLAEPPYIPAKGKCVARKQILDHHSPKPLTPSQVHPCTHVLRSFFKIVQRIMGLVCSESILNGFESHFIFVKVITG